MTATNNTTDIKKLLIASSIASQSYSSANHNNNNTSISNNSNYYEQQHRSTNQSTDYPSVKMSQKSKNIASTNTHNPSSADSDPNANLPPVVYGELSILGYNGHIPNVERNSRRNRSKYLLCKRPAPNGIKKSRHYIVKQPQATKAIQDKDLHSISYTFSRAQTIIVEYRQDENTDMFQIGRSSEDPIDFVVMDTIPACVDSTGSYAGRDSGLSGGKPSRSHQQNAENASSSHQQMVGGSEIRRYLNMAKVNEEMLRYGMQLQDQQNRQHAHFPRNQGQPNVLINYPQPNMSNLPQLVADHFRNLESPMFHHGLSHHNHHHHHHLKICLSHSG